MKFGVFDHVDRGQADTARQLGERLELAELYDRAGFFAYHVAEHHSTPLGLSSSPLLFLSSVAQRTRTLRIGPLVLPLPLYHPLRVYEEICMLDNLSGGRLELGVGRGISPHELALFGLDPDTAQGRFTEALSLLHKAFNTDELSFSGDFYNFSEVPLTIKPQQQPTPPLWYGVIRPDTAEWAAKQGMNIVCGSGPVEEIKAAIERYQATARRQEGQREPLLGMMRQIVVAPGEDEARAIARRAFKVFRHSFAWLWERNNDPLASQLLPEEFDLVEQHGEAMAGSPENIAERLAEELTASGANYLVCRFAFGDLSLGEMQQSVTLFAEEVMPKLLTLQTSPAH
jgi:alkanesulfonate monooxygenase SsuD/methylene tetrahydromethanopterin reductase-like flavin-dependent oxidoreductase (luciferase family)